MSILIDLSQIIEDSMPVYPGDDKTTLFQSRQLVKDHYNDHRLNTGMHAGTHIDGPMHLTDSTKYISDINIETFIGEGCLLDVRSQPVIGVKLAYLSMIAEDSIVLIYTGFDQYYGQPEYYTSHPVIDDQLCQLLVDKQVKMVGIDSPSPDKAPFPVHQHLFEAGIWVAENLTNLDLIPVNKHFEVIALPLNIQANGSPARIVARV